MAANSIFCDAAEDITGMLLILIPPGVVVKPKLELAT